MRIVIAWRARRTRFVAGALTAPFLAASILVAGPAGAEGLPLNKATRTALGQEIALSYTVTGIGLPILSAAFKISLASDRYTATSVVKTEGIAGLMLQSRWDTRTEGAVTAAGLRPASFRADIATSRGRGAVAIAWDGGRYKIRAVPENKPERTAALKKHLESNLPDPLTAMIATALATTGKPCKGSQRVFDGRRIVELSYQFDKPVLLKGGPHYNGFAYRCSLKLTPIAGHPPEEIAKEERSPSPAHPLWVAPVRLGKSSATVQIPVRIDLATDWGRTTVFLTESAINGRALIPAKTASN